jgi:ABC-type branched-subunit amino acid transport system substrate-binding protein
MLGRRRTGGRRVRLASGVALVVSISALLAACSTTSSSTSAPAATSSSPTTSSATATGTGSSPGVTATSVTVGQVDDLSAPLAGLFKGAEDGTRAYFDYVNSTGGVNGRKIVLDARDSAYQGGVVASATTSQINNDFALVGGFSLLDSAEQPLIDKAKVPDVAYPLSIPLADSPNVYSPNPNTANDFPLAFFKYLKSKYPTQIKHVGILWANATASTQESESVFERAMKAEGFDIVYDRGFSALESTFLPDVLAMKARGVQLFYSTQMPDSYAATLAKEMAQENFHPVVIQGAAYSAALLSDAGPAADGMYIVQSYPLYLPGQDSKDVPAAATFDHWMNVASTSPDFEIESVYGWISAELFVQALKQAGSPPTRQKLAAALDGITSFDGGGMIPPADPAQNIPASCFILAQVKGNTIVRVSPTPKTGYVCSPGGFLASPGFKPEVRPAPGS